MFCLGCGSEITIRTAFCPVCGQRIGEALGAAPTPPSSSSRNTLGMRPPALPSSPATPWRAPASQPASAYPGAHSSAESHDDHAGMFAAAAQSPTSPGVPATADATDTAPRIIAMRPPEQAGPLAGMVGIRRGDLDGLAFPRDGAGGVTLAGAAGIVLSLFLPWVSFANVNITPNHVGRFTLATIAVAILAAAPTFWGPRRRRRIAAVAPFGLGALLLGAGLLYADQYLSIAAQENVTLGVGLYLFLLSAATLVVAGYRVLMEALTAQAASAASPLPSPPVAAPPTAFPSYQLPTDAAAPASPSRPLGRPAFGSSDPVAPSAPYPPAPVAPPRPGDPRWDEATTPPPVVRRPAYGGGWGRGGVSRR